jgi:hypothetical protein
MIITLVALLCNGPLCMDKVVTKCIAGKYTPKSQA